MQSYEAILFDFDGVLVDSEPVHWECWQEILAPFGASLDWDTYSEHCIGITDRAMLAFLCELSDPPLDIERLWAEYPRKKQMFRDRMTHADALAPAVRDLVDELRRTHLVAVVTSSANTEVEPILETAGILTKLDAVVYGNDVLRHKPYPDPYVLAMRRLGVARGLAIEDSRAGVQAARAAGLDVIELRRQSDLVSEVRARVPAA